MDRSNGPPSTSDARAFSVSRGESDALAGNTAAQSPPTLREYQREAVEELRRVIQGGARRVLLVAPTGSGKSVIFGDIARRRLQKGGRVLVVAHRRELVRQAASHLRSNGIQDIRVFLGGTSLGAPDALASVAAVQTLATDQFKDRLPAADVVIWDEAHHVVAESFRAVLDKYPNAIHLGFTATPERSDGTPLGDVFEQMIVVETIAHLTEMRHLVPCIVWAPPADQQQLADDAADAYLEHGGSKRAIIFASNVPHSKGIAARLQGEGVTAEHVDGSMSQKQRDAIIGPGGRFATGETRVITNCALVTEGFDVPACKAVVIARGCDSVAMYLQIIGRALRPEPGEDHAILIDLRGAVHKHGMPDAERVFSLTGDAISGPKEKAEPIRQCLHCGHVFRPKPKCPFCGATVPEPKDPAIRRAALQRIAEAHTEDQRREYFDRLRGEAKLKGYKLGWVSARFKARYGVWPKWKQVA